MRPISFNAGAATAAPALATMFDARVSWRAPLVTQKLITIPVLLIGAAMAGYGGELARVTAERIGPPHHRVVTGDKVASSLLRSPIFAGVMAVAPVEGSPVLQLRDRAVQTAWPAVATLL
jgi:hypothetical protein